MSVQQPQPTDEWTTLSEGAATKISFDTDGDVFIGVYVGEDHIEPPTGEPFDMWQFRTVGDQGELEDGELVNINQYYDLQKSMAKVTPGMICRIERLKEIPTGRKLNPMVTFKFQTKA